MSERMGSNPENKTENIEAGRLIGPQIYKIIEQGGTTQDIVQQVYQDFYAQNPEPVFIGLVELRSKGLEGEAALKFLAQSSDNLGEIANQIINKNILDEELEKLLGIKRWGGIVTDSDRESFKKVYDHGVKSGVIGADVSFEQCLTEIGARLLLEGMVPPSHLTGEIEEEIFNESSVFGASEPTYLELLGPKEILRLRNLKEGNFLLLGSFGVYSARDAEGYTNKINPRITLNVVDNDNYSIALLAEDRENDGVKSIVKGDALQLPYADKSMEHVYTNHLLHFIARDAKGNVRDELIKLFKEAARVLKPGGSFVTVEQPYGKFLDKGDGVDEMMAKEMDSIALRSGFRVEKTLQSFKVFALRGENNSSKIDENGFPHYEHAMLEDLGGSVCKRFVKI